MKGIALLAAAMLAMAGGAFAQGKPTVAALLGEGFQVVGTTTSSAGAGLFLQSKDRLFFCLVAETQTSAEVTTRYCKPVK